MNAKKIIAGVLASVVSIGSVSLEAFADIEDADANGNYIVNVADIIDTTVDISDVYGVRINFDDKTIDALKAASAGGGFAFSTNENNWNQIQWCNGCEEDEGHDIFWDVDSNSITRMEDKPFFSAESISGKQDTYALIALSQWWGGDITIASIALLDADGKELISKDMPLPPKETDPVEDTDNISVICSSVDELQTPHPYKNNSTYSYTYTDESCENLQITFSDDSFTEAVYDIVTLYDGDNNVCCTLSGDEFEGTVVNIPGNTFKITLDTDASTTEYGFRIVSVENIDELPDEDTPVNPSPKPSEPDIEIDPDALSAEIRYIDALTPSYGVTVTDDIDNLEVKALPAPDDGNNFMWSDWCGEGISVQYPDKTVKYYQWGGAQVSWGWDADGDKTNDCEDGINGENWVGTVGAGGGVLNIPVTKGCLVEFHCLTWDIYKGVQYTLYFESGAQTASKYLKNHTHTYGDWEITVPATCTTTGIKTKTCSDCGDSVTETIEKTDHNYVDTVVKPTYTAKGYTLHKCSVCGTSYKDTYTAKLTLAKVTGAKLGGRAADALRINWTKNASADGYIVEMYQGNKWVRVAKITSNSTTTFRKAGLKAGTVYNFRVKAYKMCGTTAVYGAYSATVAARTNPSVMTGAKLGGRAADALRINWTKNASADGYIIEMYQGNKWVRAGKITNNSTTTFRKAGLKASSVYKFRVRAYKMSGSTALYGNYSATVTARTNPSVMKGVKIAGKAKDALRVNWTKNSSAQGYIVEMYKGGKWVRAAKITNNNTTTFRKAGLAKNTTYKFRVKAYYMSGKTALYGNYGSVSGKTLAK